MDDFLTPVEQAVRHKVRDRLREGGWPAGLEGLLRALDVPPAGEDGPGPALLERALVIEEVAAASPEMGRGLLRAAPFLRGVEAAAGELAWVLGSAAAAVEAGLAAARDKGLFQSALMGHQKVQGELAEAFSAVQCLRLRAYRALRLVERGEGDRGGEELARTAADSAPVRERALALARSLIGDEWTAGEERRGR